ncbi:MAG: VOC family protein [Eubacterium sp.]|nr:VOC family protein [Eubacterium sp.]
MKLEMFINFNGNCREAVELYAKVFKSEVKNLMTYGEAPQNSEYPLNESDRGKIMYADIQMGGMIVMFMDMPSDSPLIVGNNINPTVNVTDKVEVERLCGELKEGGKVYVEPQKTFFSECYAMVEDKFGVTWQILYYNSQD